jgi:hypothetical protein
MSSVKFLRKTTDTTDMSDGGRMGNVSLFSKIRTKVFRRKGQTTLEYVIMAAILVLVVMKVKTILSSSSDKAGTHLNDKMDKMFSE